MFFHLERARFTFPFVRRINRARSPRQTTVFICDCDEVEDNGGVCARQPKTRRKYNTKMRWQNVNNRLF